MCYFKTIKNTKNTKHSKILNKSLMLRSAIFNKTALPL